MIRHNRNLANLALAAAIAFHSARSLAQSSETSAAEHLKRGDVAYNIQDYETAIREYRAAYKLDPQAGLLWSVAQAQRLSGDCSTAIKTYKAYRREATSAEQSGAADAQIDKCEAELREQKAPETAAADKQEPAEPRAKTPPVAESQPVVARRSSPAEGEREVGSPPTAAYVALGTGAIGIGVGTVFGVMALQNRAALDDECKDKVCPASSRDEHDALIRNGTISTIGFGIGAAGLATGVVLLLTGGGNEADERPHARIRPWLSVGSAGVTGSF